MSIHSQYHLSRTPGYEPALTRLQNRGEDNMLHNYIELYYEKELLLDEMIKIINICMKQNEKIERLNTMVQVLSSRCGVARRASI